MSFQFLDDFGGHKPLSCKPLWSHCLFLCFDSCSFEIIYTRDCCIDQPSCNLLLSSMLLIYVSLPLAFLQIFVHDMLVKELGPAEWQQEISSSFLQKGRTSSLFLYSLEHFPVNLFWYWISSLTYHIFRRTWITHCTGPLAISKNLILLLGLVTLR